MLAPVILDIISKGCAIYGISFVSASVYQMLFGFNIFVVALTTCSKLYRQQYLGLLIILVGIGSLSYGAVTSSEDHPKN